MPGVCVTSICMQSMPEQTRNSLSSIPLQHLLQKSTAYTSRSTYVALHHSEYQIIISSHILSESTDCYLAILSFQATAAGAAHGMHLQSFSHPTSRTNLGGFPWPSVSAAIPMILSAYTQHLQGYGKL